MLGLVPGIQGPHTQEWVARTAKTATAGARYPGLPALGAAMTKEERKRKPQPATLGSGPIKGVDASGIFAKYRWLFARRE